MFIKKIINGIKLIYEIVVRRFSAEKARKMKIERVIDNYDMYLNRDENFFSKIYLSFINKDINKIFNKEQITNGLNIIDIGCGQGRILIPLAEQGHRLTGIDLSKDCIDKTRKYLKGKHLSADLKVYDIENDLSEEHYKKYDVLICTEVLYNLRNYEKIFNSFKKILKKSSIIFISLRSKLYYLHSFAIKQDWDQLQDISIDNKIFINNFDHNCLNLNEMKELFIKNQYTIININGIGVLSGISNDPQSKFITPSTLTNTEIDILSKIEDSVSSVYPENGRYVLISASQNKKY